MYKCLTLIFVFYVNVFCAQIPNRYMEEVFSGVTETNDIIFSTSVPEPKPDFSNIVVLFGGPKIAVLEHDTDNISLKMDIFEPTGDLIQKRPVVIICFGGGFVQGSRDYWSIRLLAEGFARRGYVAATIDYRLGMQIDDKEIGTRAVYRGIQDGRSAVRFFKANAALYKIDPDNIFIGGHSAGAFVALHNLYLDKDSERPSSTKDTFQDGQAIPDLGCLDCAGDHQQFSGKARGVFSLAGALGDLDYIENASEAPPILFHSEDDGTVPYGIGKPFSDLSSNPFITFDLPTVFGSNPLSIKCNDLSIPVEFNSYTDRGHGVHENGTMALHSDVLPKISAWFYEKYLKPETSDLLGPIAFCSQEATQSYSITSDNFVYFDWQVSGGNTSASNTDNEALVTWDAQATQRSVSILPYLENGVPGTQRILSPTLADDGTNSWIGANGQWNDASRWSKQYVPLACEQVKVPESVQITIPGGEILKMKTLTLNSNALIHLPSTSELIVSPN